MSSFYGVGGGWLITPILNILGFPMPYAIGTSLVYIVITSIFGTLRHRKLKNVNYPVGLIIGVSASGGVLGGNRIIHHLETLGYADTFVRILYVFLLTGIGIYMLIERRYTNTSQKKQRGLFTVRPFFTLQYEQRSHQISIPLLIGIGIVIGLLSTTMGIGGGFVLLPLLIYVVKLSVTLSIGTSLFTVMITGIQAASMYVISQWVDWQAILFMTITTVLGIFIGSSATRRINPEKIKALYAITILCGVIAILCKQWSLNILSNIVVFSTALFSTFAIIYYSFIRKSR
jgi:uncharacterized membrane protein YfcA